MFSEHSSGDYNRSLGLDRDGFIDVTPQNGFFFAGFLEFFDYRREDIMWPVTQTQEPASYNHSFPRLEVPDLAWWLALASSQLKRQQDNNPLTKIESLIDEVVTP